MALKYSTGDSTTYNELLFSKMPPQTGAFAMASVIYTKVKSDPPAAKSDLEKLNSHFPNSTYAMLIQGALTK
jgi:hypothetical protein